MLENLFFFGNYSRKFVISWTPQHVHFQKSNQKDLRSHPRTLHVFNSQLFLVWLIFPLSPFFTHGPPRENPYISWTPQYVHFQKSNEKDLRSHPRTLSTPRNFSWTPSKKKKTPLSPSFLYTLAAVFFLRIH
jgi:hypothetical protein